MAPSDRRSGYSRRAQYTTFFSYIAGVLGAVVGAALLLISIFDAGAFAYLRGMAADAAETPGQVSADTRAAGNGFFATIAGYFRAGSQNAKLQRELREAKVRLAEAEAVADENRRLRGLLGMAAQEQPVAVTQLTSSTASSTRRFATIGAGAANGVAAGMPVRSQEGLIGRVLEVGQSTSRVLLVTDTESLVPVRRASDGVPAFAQGRGDGSLQIRLINLGINPLKPGDIMVTSGSGGLYRPGTAVAAVTKLTRDGGIARVLSDPAATEYVVVEQIWAPPTKPTAAGAPAPRPEEGVQPPP
jgi:rod shape-determining protein MreC